MSKVALVVEFTAHEGKRDEVLALLAPHAAASREEPGTLRFDVLRSREEPNRVVLYELYESEEAYAFHAGTERLAALKAKAPELVESRRGILCDMHDDGGL